MLDHGENINSILLCYKGTTSWHNTSWHVHDLSYYLQFVSRLITRAQFDDYYGYHVPSTELVYQASKAYPDIDDYLLIDIR